MIRRIAIYLLSALIALQSVAAMPDTYKLYQSGTELLPAAHKYLDTDTDTDTNFDGRLGKLMPDKQLPYDCYQCSCCHTHCCFLAPSSISPMEASLLISDITLYKNFKPPVIPASIYRPPIG